MSWQQAAKTRYQEIGLVGAGDCWRFVDLQTEAPGAPCGHPSVGPIYHTKGEALADLYRYAGVYGATLDDHPTKLQRALQVKGRE
jgi:hypothetical protein